MIYSDGSESYNTINIITNTITNTTNNKLITISITAHNLIHHLTMFPAHPAPATHHETKLLTHSWQ